jgi:hypothetical protein
MCEQAKVLAIKISAHLNDPFNRITQGTLTIRAPFCCIRDPSDSAAESGDPRTRVLDALLHQNFSDGVDLEFEFRHQHREHKGQRFAVLRLAMYYRRPHLSSCASWVFQYPV